MRVVDVKVEGFAPGVGELIEQLNWGLQPDALAAGIMSSGVPLRLIVHSLALSPINFSRVAPRAAWAFTQNSALQVSATLRSRNRRRQFMQFLRLVKIV